jgi:hypothetical protein
MRGMVDASRKHGPFDTRWPCRRKAVSDRPQATPHSGPDAAERLDWGSFSALHFAGRRRHDSEALSAYAAYKQGRDWQESPSVGPPKLTLVSTEPDPVTIEIGSEKSGTQRLMAAVAELQSWEGEGGFVPSPRREGVT